MSAILPGELQSVLGASDPESLVEQNQQVLTRQIWQREPTYQNGVANTVKGPPTSGARILDELWRDSLGAEFVCISAGTPGTWKQIRPAFVNSNPAGVTTGYWICRYDENFKFYYYNGSAWVERFLALDGGTMTGLIVLSADPSSALHAATKQYVDAVAAGARDFKDSCRAATTGALAACTYANGSSGVGATLTADANGALAAQDGVTLVANDRLLVKNQASGPQNGIYKVTQVGDGGTPFILTRGTDADSNAEVTAGLAVAIAEGTTYADTLWLLTTNDAITVGTTALTFAQYGGGGGEVNTASNVGASGEGVFKQKTGVDLEFKKLLAGLGITISASGSDNVEVKTSDDARTLAIPILIDDGTSSIATGEKRPVEIPFACDILGWSVLGNASGSIEVKIARATYSGLPTFSEISTSGERPALSSAQKAQDLSLTTWAATSLAAGDWLMPDVVSSSGLAWAMISLRVRRNT